MQLTTCALAQLYFLRATSPKGYISGQQDAVKLAKFGRVWEAEFSYSTEDAWAAAT